ncbi:Kup system potassium uptake protein, partial [hydrothermal vent metagenome]
MSENASKPNGKRGRVIQPHGSRQQGAAVAKLAAGAIGIVFGDIGTSPLYAFRETFVGAHPLELDRIHVLGVVSLIFWSMTLVVSIQYVTILMRADNKGQGGSLSLVALLLGALRKSKYGWVAILLGVFATSLFYGDSMITPAISVLSAVEGL